MMIDDKTNILINEQKLENCSKLIIHRMNQKKFVEARRKWVRKNIHYISLLDNTDNSLLELNIWSKNYVDKDMDIADTKSVCKPLFNMLVMGMTVEDAMWFVLTKFITDELHRSNYQHTFIFSPYVKTPKALSRIIEKDQEKIRKYDEKVLKEMKKAQEENDDHE